jgi:hypothetical protein
MRYHKRSDDFESLHVDQHRPRGGTSDKAFAWYNSPIMSRHTTLIMNGHNENGPCAKRLNASTPARVSRPYRSQGRHVL